MLVNIDIIVSYAVTVDTMWKIQEVLACEDNNKIKMDFH
jgi:hypothetical protein